MGKGGGCMPSKKKFPISESAELPGNQDEGTDVITRSEIEGPKKLRIFIVFYSMYGHIESLARRIKKGTDGIEGVEGVLYKVPETLTPDVLEKMKVPQKDDGIPVISVDELVEADGFLFGFPTRYGCMAAQMKAFFDSTGKLWREQKLAGVPAGFFVSTGTQGGGQETTAWTAITQLVHHGMLYVPIGYTFGAGMFRMDSIRGGSPYGAGTFSGDGSREPSEPELALAEHQGFGGSLNAEGILDFVDSGHDLILAADASVSDLIREIATECGVDFDEDPAAMVVDHTSYAVSDTEGDHTLIAGDAFIQSDVILGREKIKAPVLFNGIGHSVNPSNSLVLKILSASPSAYSANPKSELSAPPILTGSTIGLVSVVQARNNARILISGSLSMFSNRFFRSGVQKAGSTINHEKSGNEQFVTEISKWAFQERGHLKAVNVRHHKIGEADEPSIYRVNDELEYSVDIYEWSGTSWEPYVADDVQVQFYMMSPYILKTLSTNKKGVYYTSFKVPDVYGVFQFKVEYEKLGFTSLSLSKQIPVRPFRHNEYERFITAAFPYYGASFSMMGGFFLFSLVYLYHK